jgi:hypothetical protein
MQAKAGDLGDSPHSETAKEHQCPPAAGQGEPPRRMRHAAHAASEIHLCLAAYFYVPVFSPLAFY